MTQRDKEFGLRLDEAIEDREWDSGGPEDDVIKRPKGWMRGIIDDAIERAKCWPNWMRKEHGLPEIPKDTCHACGRLLDK